MTAGRTLLRRVEARVRATDTFRRWSLGSTLRCGKGVYDEIRGRRRAEVARLGRRMAVALSLAALLAVGFALFLPAGPLLRGVVAGGLFAGACGAVFHTVAVSSGVAWRKYGVEAERWTAAILRPRPWRKDTFLVNAVPLDRVDLDHVLITPRGVLAVETKWTSNPWDARASDVAAFGSQLRQRADRLGKILASEGAKVPVDCVLVLWGQQGTRVPSAGVPVVAGSELGEFLDRAFVSSRGPVDPESVWRALAAYVERRDAYEGRKRKGLKSFQRLAGESFVTAAVVFAAVLVVAVLADLPGPVGSTLCVLGLAGVALGVGWSRRRFGRHVALAATGAYVGMSGLIAARVFGLVG